MKKILLLISLVLILQGCVVAVGGAAVGAAGTAVIYDQRSIKTMLQDDDIAYAIAKKLQAEPNIANQCHIVISSYNGIVLLAGQSPNEELKKQAVELAKTIPNIRRLYNEITIEGPSSELARSNDAWLTTKVKGMLFATKDLKSGQFKVVTENGTVFLMGIVTREQADKAVEVTRHIDGVQKVVKIFEYRHDSSQIQDKSDNKNKV